MEVLVSSVRQLLMRAQLVFIGDSVDVDIDEPAVTIRWSILACGANFTLSGSEGTHGSTSCGVPEMALQIFVDG